ncbi:related to DNA repair protein RAD7 [Zygosaccharomyces bailii]|nr:related to DNA repair protein RAD7 [Zygosaccharomyces bailii ISA1307]SJM85713.1 related to DNA repair protein RAD7 [Zygosaccharomyces bailii]
MSLYRSRNRGRTGPNDVKGPSSALTQFLRDEGISAQVIKERWEKQQEDKRQREGSNSLEQSVEPSPQIEKTILVDDESTDTDTDGENFKKLSSFGTDSDEEEYEEGTQSPAPAKKTPRTRGNADGKTKKVLESRRKKRKKAAQLLDRRLEFPSLQELCIHKIGTNISKWNDEADEQSKQMYANIRKVLGGISTENLNTLGRALSKNRALNDQTLQLFLKTDLSSLVFHDCSKVSYEGYKALAIFCPHLNSLSLQMCGQLNNEALLYIAEKLPHLASIKLDGPFLINEDTWDLFFQRMSGRLKEIQISNTHRFTDSSLSSLLRNCGSQLVSLHLSRLDSVSNYALLSQYLQNTQFHTLGINYPYNEEDVNDEVIMSIVAQVGGSLRYLSLNGCVELTDNAIVNGLSLFLQGNDQLETLELEELGNITSDSLVHFFKVTPLPHLRRCSLKRCTQLTDEGPVELLLNEAKDSLEDLNFNSLIHLTQETFQLMHCPNLRHLDASFVSCVDDQVIDTVGRQNVKLQLMEVFGDNLVSSNARIRSGLTLVGRQSDSI